MTSRHQVVFTDPNGRDALIRTVQRRVQEDWFSQYRGIHCARSRAKRGHGTHYEVDREELSILQDQTFSSNSAGWRPAPAPVTMLQALDQLLEDDSATNKEAAVWAAADQRITSFQASGAPVKWDLAIKIFDDFDAVYFHGDLRRRVLLKWKEFGTWEELRPLTDSSIALAITCGPNQAHNMLPRVMIAMRTDCGWSHPALSIPGTLLHEMVDAFFDIQCGAEGSFNQPGDNHDHGHIWVAAAKRIKELSGFDLHLRMYEQHRGQNRVLRNVWQ